MNVVLDNASEINIKSKTTKQIGERAACLPHPSHCVQAAFF
jgi:small nuclear ribonucleoprotein (snRNP)-like protein